MVHPGQNPQHHGHPHHTTPLLLHRHQPPVPLPLHRRFAAADSSGLLVLRATATHPFTTSSYHLCDALSGKVAAIPSHSHGNTVGLFRRDRGDEFIVAELRPARDGSGKAMLLCFTAGGRQWVEKKLTYSPPPPPLFGDRVVSHFGMLWWVDLSYGILACDPFADDTELLYVPLPKVAGDELPADPVYRCVQVSEKLMRHVQIHRSAAEPVVMVSAFAGEWVRDRSAPLRDVWAELHMPT